MGQLVGRRRQEAVTPVAKGEYMTAQDPRQGAPGIGAATPDGHGVPESHGADPHLHRDGLPPGTTIASTSGNALL
jgi:hypothetical protein